MVRRLMVPLDGSDLAEIALPHAAALARAFGAELFLARVPEATLVPVMSAGVWITKVVETPDAQAEATRYLEAASRRPVLAGLQVRMVVVEQPVVDGLIGAVRAEGVDLLVLSTHGRTGAMRWAFGSVAERLVHGVRGSVYVVRAGTAARRARIGATADHPARTEPAPREGSPGDGQSPAGGAGPLADGRIVVPLDGSELAELAVERAATLARAVGGSVNLVRVPGVPGYLTVVPETAGWIPEQLRESASAAEAYLSDLAEALRRDGADADHDVRAVIEGAVADGILDHAHDQDASLIVMSSHGRSGFGRWIYGSVADRVLRGAECPVWVVRKPAGE